MKPQLMCVRCAKFPRAMLFLPCCHFVYCKACSQTLAKPSPGEGSVTSCPRCLVPITVCWNLCACMSCICVWTCALVRVCVCVCVYLCFSFPAAISPTARLAPRPWPRPPRAKGPRLRAPGASFPSRCVRDCVYHCGCVGMCAHVRGFVPGGRVCKYACLYRHRGSHTAANP